jgi:hypothetical protein
MVKHIKNYYNLNKMEKKKNLSIIRIICNLKSIVVQKIIHLYKQAMKKTLIKMNLNKRY